ncbi:unnamed protein product [Urochloa decumbens]|uniref:DUF1618 domain-containing protein n=1 Tax=Urochloa decumbens TaxID=240449 RepID=A0ABC9BC16_9POAL
MPTSLREGRAGRHSYLTRENTGLLRRGEDEFVVADLNVVVDDASGGLLTPELRLLRSGGCSDEWSLKRPPIKHHHGGDLPCSWNSDTVIPIDGDRLCWVDLSGGLLFSDVFEESPGLWYVPLPEDPFFGRGWYRNVCVTSGGTAIKFVNTFPRCCCGGAGASYCQHSHHAYTVHTWTLTVDHMAWVMDGSINTTELWSLDGYEGLPRIELDCPVVSLDEPHCICFELCEWYHVRHGDDTKWQIMVDMRSKTLRSSFRYPQGRWHAGRRLLFPSRVSKYFNSEPDDGMQGPAPAETVPNLTNSNITGAIRRPACQLSNPPMQVSSLAKILGALKEIPDLDRDDMLKAYRTLQESYGCPNGSEEGLCAMEIKATEDCFICSGQILLLYA